ncbi:SET domain [Trypanosoma melophagium]|uniref:SET domain n=1 Tax=Trypanosoma melophagium TaxID=715481 RepID=UPI00351A2444|nr:SET domain [Trypanosoma melophagium]
MMLAPQDRLVECTQSSDQQQDDAGRYAIAKDDISPGELAFIAAPYVVAINPNRATSAMYIVVKVEEWENVSGRTETTNAQSAKPKKKGKRLPTSDKNGYIPLISTTTVCCNCLKHIPVGTAFLNYETIKQVSDDIVIEHAEREERQRQKKEEDALDEKAQSTLNEEEIAGDGSGKKKIEESQKPTGSTRMRSKKYVDMKQKMLKTATAQREAEMYENHMKTMRFHDLKEISWPERLVEEQKDLPENVLKDGICGCSGCGVVVYCSKECWMEFREMHKKTGDCETLRNVYPSLMKGFGTRGCDNKKKIPTGSLSLDSWSVKHWIRRTSEETAFEMQSLLLAALLVARCVKEGYASHMTEEEESTTVTEETNESSSKSDSINTTDKKEGIPSVSNEKDPSDKGNVTVAFTTDSTIPNEVKLIRALRLRSGTMIEVMDPKAVPHEHDGNAEADEESKIPLTVSNHTILSVGISKEATHAIRDPRWFDAAQLITNISVLSKASRSTFRRYYRRFVKLVLPWLNGGSETTDSTLTISHAFFDRISAAAQCNSFGLFDAKGDCIGVALYPEASYFNHSCLPNLCRVKCRGRLAAFYALRKIRKGDPLTICYVDVQEKSSAERRRILLESYRFFCQCERCHGCSTTTTTTTTTITTASNATTATTFTANKTATTTTTTTTTNENTTNATTTLIAPGIRLCDACDARGYLRPVPPIGSSSWDMDEVQGSECTICYHRV